MSSRSRRHSRSRTRGSSHQSEDDESSGSDMDLDKELHPLGHYMNDREEMLNQVFKVIKGPKLRAMLTSGLRDLDVKELKALCLTQLEGMSKKRIKYILAGRDMDESSATDDSEEDENDEEEDEEGMAGSLGDIIKPALLKKQPSNSPKIEEPIEVQDSPEENADKKDMEEEEEDDDLQDVISKQTKDLVKKQSVDLKVGKKVVKKDEETTAAPVVDQKVMELLELEMRARAIKSLLSKTKKDDGPLPELKKDENKDEEDQKVGLIKEVKDPEEARKQLEEEKRLHKAREALSVSMAKKRKEDEEIEKKNEEIKKRIEEQEAIKKAEEEEIQKKAEAEAEKIRKKAKKEEDHENFLKWKEEKAEREREARLQEARELDQRARNSLKRKTLELLDKEEKERMEREKINDETEMKKSKISREDVEDELEYSYDHVSLQCEENFDENQSKDTENRPKRRYRRKGEGEEGEIEGSPVDWSRSRSRSYSSRSGSETSLSMSDESEDENRKLEKLRRNRLERVQEIKERKRKRKPASDISDGEVDSDGENFAVVKNNPEYDGEKLENENAGNPETPKEDQEETEVENIEGKSKEIPQLITTGNRDDIHDDEKMDIGKSEQSAIEEDVAPGDDLESSSNVNEPMETSEPALDEDSRPSMDDSQDSIPVQEDESQESPEEKAKRSKRSWKDRHLKREQEKQEKQKEKQNEIVDPDYEFKTKRQKAYEQEFAPDPEVEAHEDEEIERQKKEAKEREKKQKQLELRLKRMQAFQARSGMQEEDDSDFYKSYYEEEARQKLEDEEKNKQKELENETPEEKSETVVERPKLIEITDKDLPKRDPEVSEKEGIAYWSKMCEPELKAKPAPKKTTKPDRGTKDLPSKAQMDAQQVEQQTWADRWYQNKGIQKIVKDSSLHSKVRKQIKTKNKSDDTTEKVIEEAPGTSAKDLKAEALRRKAASRIPKNTELPVIGTLDEFSKLTKKDEAEETPKEIATKSSDEDEDDEEDGDFLAILGKK